MIPNEWAYLVNGEFRKDGEPLEVRSCIDNSVVATTFRPPDSVVEQSVEAAINAFPSTQRIPTFERAEVLRKMAAGVEERREELVRMLALEAGKPVKAGRVEVDRCVFNLRIASEEIQRIEHELFPLDLVPAAKQRWGAVRRFPIGAVLAITPFNFPLNLVAHKIAPALGVGNTVVQKPASQTPVCSLLLAEIAHQSGVSAGALNVIPCLSSQAEKLACDERFQLLTFTGSSEVGWRLKSKAGRKRVTLELGGNAGVIVHSDCDVTDSARRCTIGGFTHSGQSCIAVQRIFVHRPVLQQFTKALVDRVQSLGIGDPLGEETDVGPMISISEAERVELWVQEAVRGGARILTGGKREGPVYYPTVLTNTRPDMRVNCNEIFGPVVTVEGYDSFSDALAAVNDSSYGLQAGLFTSDNRRIFEAFERLEVGGVVANDVPTFRVDHMPYGGVKESGTGREGARYAIEEMTERKILVLNLE